MISPILNELIMDESPKPIHSEENKKYSSIDRDDVTVIIPTLNEEQAISKVLEELKTYGYKHILVVDGFSIDNTVSIVKKNGVKIIEQEGGGKTGAIKTALENIYTPYFVLIDGDYTYSAKDIEQLFPYMRNAQQVIGSRANGRKNISPMNRFGNWGINKIFNLFNGTNLTDVCSGLYIMETEFAKKIPFRTEGFDVEVEIAAYTAKNGVLREANIGYYSRIGQRKLRPLRDGVKILSTILRQALN
jgi:dolichol-phosphate mannosyltransferase